MSAAGSQSAGDGDDLWPSGADLRGFKLHLRDRRVRAQLGRGASFVGRDLEGARVERIAAAARPLLAALGAAASARALSFAIDTPTLRISVDGGPALIRRGDDLEALWAGLRAIARAIVDELAQEVVDAAALGPRVVDAGQARPARSSPPGPPLQVSRGPAEFGVPMAVMEGSRPEHRVEIVDLSAGEGPEVRADSRVMLHYTAALAGGAVFDGSRGRERPLQARLGAQALCRGLEQGLVGMRPGGLRRITVPPPLGYGPRGIEGVVPPLTDVIFEVELLEVDGVAAALPLSDPA